MEWKGWKWCILYFELDELEGLAEGLAVDGKDVGDILGTFVG